MSTPKTPKSKAKSAPPAEKAPGRIDPEITNDMREKLRDLVSLNEIRQALEPDNIVHINRLHALRNALAEFPE